MRMKAMQRGKAIGKDRGGIIAIALGDVPWMNRNLRFVAGLSLNNLFYDESVSVTSRFTRKSTIYMRGRKSRRVWF